MFRPDTNNVTSPVTTAMFLAPATGSTATDYIANFRATDPNTIATLGALVLAVIQAASHVNDSPLRTNARKAFRGASYTPALALFAAPDPAATTDDAENVRAIRLNLPSTINWLADLINAAKKKTITDENVEGYFASVGHTGTKPGVIARFINQLQAYFPDQIGNDAFRAMLAPGVWTTYRVTRVSTGIILSDLLTDFRALRITTNGDATEIAIDACRASPWNVTLSANIPDKYKAYGCIFLQAAGTPIDDWYQGNKAVDALPAARVRGAKAIFKKYLEVKNNVNVDTLADVAAFTASDAVRDFF